LFLLSNKTEITEKVKQEEKRLKGKKETRKKDFKGNEGQ
jgi:hypothetical protein